MHTGNRSHDHRGYAEQMTPEQLDGLLSEAWLRKMVADIRGDNEALKDYLPYICPHYSAFRNNHRAQADIIPEAFTYMTCVDVDDKELVAKAIEQAMAVNDDPFSDWEGQVLRIEYSARKKVHIYIRIPKGLTIEEAQRAFCQEVGVPYDESCITPERFIYLTGKDEEIYRSDKWLQDLTDEELAERREAYLERGLDVDGRKCLTPCPSPNSPSPTREGRGEANSSTETATPRALAAFDLCAEQAGLNPSEMDVWGVHNWHANLMAVLSIGVAKLMSREQLQAVVAQRLPNYCQTADCKKLIDYFYEKYDADKGFMNTALREINAKAQKTQNGTETQDEAVTPQETSIKSSLSAIYANSLPPRMPKQLPKLIALLTKNTPAEYKPTVAHAVFPALGVHLHKVKFLYTDNVPYEATLMNVAMAGTGAGKSCIDEPINRIMADIRDRDSANEKRLDDYNREMNRKGANKDKRDRPEDLVIQEIHSDTTHAALVQRLAEAKERFLYMKLNEIELFDKLKGTGGQQFVLMCQAFDTNNRYGQTRASTQAVNATVQLRFNWNAAGTIGAVTRYFSKVLTKGPISRINFCTIPEREIGAEQPVYGIYDEAFDEALKPYIRHLTEAGGDVECKQARSLAKRLIAECAEFSRLSQDRVYENLSFRANVIAYLKACVLYVANGQKWEKSIEDFIRWSLHYDLWCKMQFFADDIRREMNAGKRTNHRGPQNLMDFLHDEFTLEEAKNMRIQRGMDTEHTAKMIQNWIDREYVTQYSELSFKKAPRFCNGK